MLILVFAAMQLVRLARHIGRVVGDVDLDDLG
jgi:hypothetical protein